MYEFFVDSDAVSEHQIYITGKDAHHIRDVLRMRPGEELAVSDGSGTLQYQCTIREFTEAGVTLDILYVNDVNAELPCRIALFQGLPKSDKMEWIIQKAVELGASEIIPVETKRSVVKIEDKKKSSRVERWQNIAEAAAKQSKRRKIPKIEPIMSFGEALSYAEEFTVKLIPYELAEDMNYTRKLFTEEIKPGDSIAVFIGPEGGFAPEEIEKAQKQGAHPITLGRRILRTETAGMTVLSWLLYLLEDREEE